MLRHVFFVLVASQALAGAVAQEPARRSERPLDTAALKQLAEKIEPTLKGNSDRLAQYVNHFRHEAANDRRLFAFHVDAAAEGNRGVRLTGFV